jgi:DDE domain
MQEDGLLPKLTKLRSLKYLNNLIEQDHRGIKSRTRPMLGFKNYHSAATTIAGVELLHRISKEQFSLWHLHLKDQAAPVIWNAVLAAYERSLFQCLFWSVRLFAPEPSSPSRDTKCTATCEVDRQALRPREILSEGLWLVKMPSG